MVARGGGLVEAAWWGAEEVTVGEDAFEGRKVGIGVMEVDARDGLGGREGGLPEAAAVKIRG